jgi:hypothetical protein
MHDLSEVGAEALAAIMAQHYDVDASVRDCLSDFVPD